MTLDLNTANLLTMTGGNGGATAHPATNPSGGSQTQGTVPAGGAAAASPFAMLVDANQAQAAANANPAASLHPAAASAASVRGQALASASPLPMDRAAAGPTMPAAATTSPEAILADEIILPVTPVAPAGAVRGKPAMPVQDAIDPAGSVAPATEGVAVPVAPGQTTADLATPQTRAAAATDQTQSGIAAASLPVNDAPAMMADKAVSGGKPVSEIIPAKPEPATVAAPQAAAAQAQARTQSQAQTPTQTPVALATSADGPDRVSAQAPTTGQGQAAAPGAQAPAQAQTASKAQPQATGPIAQSATIPAPATPDRVTPAMPGAAGATAAAKPGVTKSGTAPDTGTVDTKPAPLAPSRAAAGLNSVIATSGHTAPAATATAPATTATAPGTGVTAPEQMVASANAGDGTPLRQRGSNAPAIQTASDIAARASRGTAQAGNSAANSGQSGKSGSAGNSGNPAAGTTAPATPASDPAAALAVSRNALPTAAQSGAPITPLPATPGDAPLPQAISADQAAAESALRAESDFNLARVDGRMAADRSGATLPRFTPHTTQHLAGQITKQVSNGNRVFDIRLDPAELGKVDVRIELRADNRVHAVLTVERPETLSELQRSARDLERSLAAAGLELDEDGLSFQMSDGHNQPGDEGRNQGEALPIFTQTTDMAQRAEDELASRPRSAYGFLLSGRSGVDMQV